VYIANKVYFTIAFFCAREWYNQEGGEVYGLPPPASHWQLFKTIWYELSRIVTSEDP
jgi:hypothetical protein